MPSPIEDLVTANRILDNEGILDAFGHVSVRHPDRPGHYLMSRYKAPALVTPSDITEFDETDAAVTNTGDEHYSERTIHGSIMRARSDVNAAVHTHAMFVMPFAISGTPIVPVSHIGACLGTHIPFWDPQDEFGDTNQLVATFEQGASLARALGPSSVVIMRRHGASVAGTSIADAVLKSIHLSMNAGLQLQAQLLGSAPAMPAGEVAMCGQVLARPRTLKRAWDYWAGRLPLSNH